jgi:SAM-dependent methyltransferase
MAALTDKQDAYGHALWDYYHGRHGMEVDERSDGYVGTVDVADYFAECEDWPMRQKQAVELARGGVLDVGCGAGRVALHVQEMGLDVLGIDNSPLAVEVCKLRGLKRAQVLSITELSSKLGIFDTAIMFGNNFGLFGGFRRARWLLRRLRGLTSERAQIIAETVDPYRTDDPDYLAYQALNRSRGRLSGQMRLRVRYKTLATPWFDYLFVSRDEMRELLDGTGWAVCDFIDQPDSPSYVAVIHKTP